MSTVNDSKPVDLRVDAVFGEPVVLKPMTYQKSGYRESIPDPDRPPVIAVGIHYQGRGPGIEDSGVTISKMAMSEVSLSIRYEPVEQCDLTKGDRVFFPDRDETYEVSYIDDSSDGRWDVYLLKVIE
jgi:hypothetical protein